jgi:hypothetical protein
MTDNAGPPPPAAANKDPGDNPFREGPIELSQGNAVLQQILNFIERMSCGRGVQPFISVFVPVLVALIVIAVITAIAFVSSQHQHGSLLLTGGAAVIGGVTTTLARRKHRRSKAAGDQPRDQSSRE